MSNPYKEIVKGFAKDNPYFTRMRRISSLDQIENSCFFCIAPVGDQHAQDCAWQRAKDLLKQDPDSEEDNPWILCHERMPTEEGKQYLVTLERNGKYWVECVNYEWFVITYKYGFQKVNGVPTEIKIIAWMPKPKPYQPPAQKPPKPVSQPDKPPEPAPDPLMGWIPEWKEKPKDRAKAWLMFEDANILLGCYATDNDQWYMTPRIPCATPVAWKYYAEGEFPDPKLFEKPTPPPLKHLPPDFTWKRLCEELPTKPGRYYFFDEDRNVIIEQIITKDRFPFKDAEEIQRLIGFGTHWVLLSVFV